MTALQSALSGLLRAAARTGARVQVRPRRAYRPEHAGSYRGGRDLNARFARPAPPPAASPPQGASTSTLDAFYTASTTPAGTTMQSIPPPAAPGSSSGVKLENPVPAMVQPSTTTSISSRAGKETVQKQGEITVQGIVVPPKPIPPGEEGRSLLPAKLTADCCMSGCVHCVYNIYADELELYTEHLDQARKALVAAGIPPDQWPERVRSPPRDHKAAELKKVEDNMDPALAAFLALEKKIKQKQ